MQQEHPHPREGCTSQAESSPWSPKLEKSSHGNSAQPKANSNQVNFTKQKDQTTKKKDLFIRHTHKVSGHNSSNLTSGKRYSGQQRWKEGGHNCVHAHRVGWGPGLPERGSGHRAGVHHRPRRRPRADRCPGVASAPTKPWSREVQRRQAGPGDGKTEAPGADTGDLVISGP